MTRLLCKFSGKPANYYIMFDTCVVSNNDLSITVSPPSCAVVRPVNAEGTAFHFEVLEDGMITIGDFVFDADAYEDPWDFTVALSSGDNQGIASWQLEPYGEEPFIEQSTQRPFTPDALDSDESFAGETRQVDIPKGFNHDNEYHIVDGVTFKFSYLQGPSLPLSDEHVDTFLLKDSQEPLGCMATDVGPYWWELPLSKADSASALFGCVNVDKKTAWWSLLYHNKQGFWVKERGGLFEALPEGGYQTFQTRLSPSGTLVPLDFKVWWENPNWTELPHAYKYRLDTVVNIIDPVNK